MQKGTATVEVALTISLFIGMIAAFLWLSLLMNARTSLTISLAQALRWGVTRGSDSAFGDTIPFNDSIKSFLSSGSPDDAGSYASAVKKLLYKKARAGDNENTFDVGTLTQEIMGKVFPTATLQDLPVTYLKALMGLHEYMRVRVGGNNLRYPCKDAPNCLHCEFLNPGYADDGACSDVSFIDNTGYCAVPVDSVWADTLNQIPANRITMRCSYVPDFGLLKVIMGTLGLKKTPVVSRTFSIVYSSDL